ncbi:hypothetical protein DL95DRAFT_521859 [Leptodontidium sp. 2 PMI_412]|nr:hypothetical protein DL95DRAFT_521859 [Leptodontidium sp. 2 PMI_412]
MAVGSLSRIDIVSSSRVETTIAETLKSPEPFCFMHQIPTSHLEAGYSPTYGHESRGEVCASAPYRGTLEFCTDGVQRAILKQHKSRVAEPSSLRHDSARSQYYPYWTAIFPFVATTSDFSRLKSLKSLKQPAPGHPLQQRTPPHSPPCRSSGCRLEDPITIPGIPCVWAQITNRRPGLKTVPHSQCRRAGLISVRQRQSVLKDAENVYDSCPSAPACLDAFGQSLGRFEEVLLNHTDDGCVEVPATGPLRYGPAKLSGPITEHLFHGRPTGMGSIGER